MAKCSHCLHWDACSMLFEMAIGRKPTANGNKAEEKCPHFKDKTINTNADRIRAMSDEELADFFFESPEIEFELCEYCEYFGGYTSDTPCKHDMGRCFVSAKSEAFKKWLKQPAEGD